MKFYLVKQRNRKAKQKVGNKAHPNRLEMWAHEKHAQAFV
jgi:hypothetical protein